MLQVKFFYFDLHKPKGAKQDTIEKAINEWLEKAGNITVLTDDASPMEVTQGHIIWTIWYEDHNKKDDEDTPTSLSYLEYLESIDSDDE